MNYSQFLYFNNFKENHPILNRINNILLELQTQGKKLYRVKSLHTVIKRNEETGNAAKRAIDMPGMTT